jgi:hypothetical protein
MAIEIHQVLGLAAGQVEVYKWVVATYDNKHEADQHTQFLQELYEQLEARDREMQPNAPAGPLLTRLSQGHPYDPGFPREAGVHVLYKTVTHTLRSRTPVAPAGVQSALDKFLAG